MRKLLSIILFGIVLSVAAGAAPVWPDLLTKRFLTGRGRRAQGYLAYDRAIAGPRPAVLVVHEWWGLNDYIKQRVRQVADLGYIAFAADIYGNGL